LTTFSVTLFDKDNNWFDRNEDYQTYGEARKEAEAMTLEGGYSLIHQTDLIERVAWTRKFKTTGAVSVTVTTFRVTYYDPEDVWEQASSDFESATEALAHAKRTTDVGHSVVERVDVTPLFALRQTLKCTEIT
jgi:hypothetical protein